MHRYFHRHRRRLSLAWVCLGALLLGGMPLPIGHDHQGLSASFLLQHLPQRHAASLPEGSWHWHYCTAWQWNAEQRSQAPADDAEGGEEWFGPPAVPVGDAAWLADARQAEGCPCLDLACSKGSRRGDASWARVAWRARQGGPRDFLDTYGAATTRRSLTNVALC